MVRVFTRGSEGGNHLGVVNDLVDLDDAAMQQIATDLGFSETVFIDWQGNEIPFVRIFTPAEELPFAGHPLVGAAWCMTVIGPGEMDRLRYSRGEAMIKSEGALTWVQVPMDAPVKQAGDAAAFLSRAGIDTFESAARVMMPLEYVLAELPTAADVSAVVPDMTVLSERFGTLVYARAGHSIHGRFFAPRTAVDEDPATGSAAVALATLFSHGGEDEGHLTVDQGVEMGHPSRIEVSWRDGRAAIGGTVVRDEVRLLDL